MVGVQERLRIRVVQFFKRIRRANPRWKMDTVRHFMADGVTESTIYRIINRYLATGTTGHRKGTGRPWRIMTSLACARLRRLTILTSGRSIGVTAKTVTFLTVWSPTWSLSWTHTTPGEGISFERTRPALNTPRRRHTSLTSRGWITSTKRTISPKFHNIDL